MITRGYGSDRILVDRKAMVADNCESEMSKAAEAGVKCSYGWRNRLPRLPIGSVGRKGGWLQRRAHGAVARE